MHNQIVATKCVYSYHCIWLHTHSYTMKLLLAIIAVSYLELSEF